MSYSQSYSYVEKGFKYGVILNPNNSTIKLKDLLEETKPRVNFPRKKELEVTCPVDRDDIIEFDDISGLAFKDISDYEELLYDNQYLIFVMYDSISVGKRSNAPSSEKAIIRYICSLDATRYPNMTVDDLIGNVLVKNELLNDKPYLSQGNKKRALGFLEKYVYKDSRETYHAAYSKIMKSENNR